MCVDVVLDNATVIYYQRAERKYIRECVIASRRVQRDCDQYDLSSSAHSPLRARDDGRFVPLRLLEKAWIDSFAFTEWMRLVFIPHAKPAVNSRVLLLLDNHTTHFGYEAVKLAYDTGVDLFPFPRNASHLIQPLDVGVFGSLKVLFQQEWSAEMTAISTTGAARPIDRVLLIRTIMNDRVFKNAFQPVCIARGWRLAGLCPIDSTAVPLSSLTPDSKRVERKGDHLVTTNPPRAAKPPELATLLTVHPQIESILQPPVLRSTKKPRAVGDRGPIVPRLITPELALQWEQERSRSKRGPAKAAAVHSAAPQSAVRTSNPAAAKKVAEAVVAASAALRRAITGGTRRPDREDQSASVTRSTPRVAPAPRPAPRQPAPPPPSPAPTAPPIARTHNPRKQVACKKGPSAALLSPGTFTYFSVPE